MYRITAKVVEGSYHADQVGDAYESEREALRGLARLKDPTYEGWANRETWAVNLWLNNEEQLYGEARFIARNRPTAAESEDDLAEMVENLVLDSLAGGLPINLEGGDPPASLALDLLQGALGRVEWREIVAGFREDMDPATIAANGGYGPDYEGTEDEARDLLGED